MTLKHGIAVVVVVLVTASTVVAASFPAQREAGGRALMLQGTGVLRFKLFWPLYDAAFYLERGAASGAWDDPALAKRLEVVYRRDLPADRLTAAGDRILANLHSPAKRAEQAEALARFNAWYPDVAQGDRCAVTYVPGRGTELTHNGRALGTVPGNEFAAYYLAIWLGAEPADAGLRDELLGREDP
jgi:hypothetical protein